MIIRVVISIGQQRYLALVPIGTEYANILRLDRSLATLVVVKRLTAPSDTCAHVLTV